MHKSHTTGKANCIVAGKSVIITCSYPRPSFRMGKQAKIKFWYKIYINIHTMNIVCTEWVEHTNLHIYSFLYLMSNN